MTNDKMTTIGVIVAMDKEFAQLRTLLTEATTETHNGHTFTLGKIADKTIVATQCGIGKVNSAIGAVELIDAYHPNLIISTGVAGGADPTLNVCEVCVSTACTYHDAYCGTECAYGQILGMPERYASPEALVSKALSIDCGTPIHSGLTVSGEWFVDSRDKMQEILNHFPEAKAVDMESCSIAQTCHIYGVPFVSFRIISDVPLNDHKAQMYYDFWDRMADGSFHVTKAFLEAI